MNWNTIRLELASTEDFPRGSTGRAYLLRAPLNDDGLIDRAALERSPTEAIVRRFWASDPDESGQLMRVNGGWCIRCDRGRSGEALFRLGHQPLRLDGQVTIEEPDGRCLPFRVASIKRLG